MSILLGFVFFTAMSRSYWQSAIFHEPLRDGRTRDVFPLPHIATQKLQNPNMCRSVSRRVLCRSRVAGRVNRAVDALNSLFFGGMTHCPKRDAVGDISELGLNQRLAMTDLIAAVKRLGAPPAGNSGALKALRVAASSYFTPEVGVGDVVAMQFDRLSLPSDGTAGVDLVAAIEPSIRDVVDKFEDFMLQDADVWTSISRDSSHLKPYSDPSLKSRPKYLSFIKMLHDRGILSFTDRCRGRVGAFTVSKKPKVVDGVIKHRQRLVLDCRQTNQLFRPAPHTELGSLASLTEIKLPAGEKMFISGADIQDCFYAVHIPGEMMQFFCLEFDVTPEEACWVSGSDSLLGRFENGARFLSPCINVLPMGFSWSFFLVQHIHQSSVCRSLSISEDSLFLDGRPSPTLAKGSIYSMPYCDNIHSISLGKDLCEQGKIKIVDDLTSLGFTIHEDEHSSTRFETLGGEIDGEAGQIRMTSRRAWDLIYAFEHVAHHTVSPSTMQQLLGHAMFFSTLNRAGMSVFRRCYDFVEKGWVERRLNEREREECLTFAGLIPLLYADIRRGWCQTVQCTDASPDGFGICETTLSSSQVESMGRWCERWRYRRLPPEDWAPRRRALARDPLSDPFTVLGWQEGDEESQQFVENDDFPEIPLGYLAPEKWRTALMGKWDSQESITIKEGRALIICLRRLLRSSRNRHKRHLIFVDNLGLALAVTKGRAKKFKLLRITQQVAAMTLIGSFNIRLRWLPSECNVADGPSRGQIAPGPFKSFSSEGGEACSNTCFEQTDVESGKTNIEEKAGGASEDASGSTSICKSPKVRIGGEEAYSIQTHNHKDPGESGERCWEEGSESADDSAGGEVSVNRSPKSIRNILPTVREFLPGQWVGMASSQRCGRNPGRLFRSDVSRREVSCRGRESSGLSRVQQHPVERKTCSVQKGIERLEEGKASSVQASIATSGGCRNGNADGVPGTSVDGPEVDVRSRHVSSSWRKHRIESKRRGGAGQEHWQTLQVAFNHSAGHRGLEARQSRNLRQFDSSKQCRSPVFGPPDLESRSKAEQQGESFVSFHCSTVSKSFPKVWRNAESEKFAPLSNKTWRGIRRFEQRRSRFPASEDQRSLAYRPKRAEVRQGGEDSEIDGKFVASSHGILSVVSQKHGEGVDRENCSRGAVNELGWQDVFSVSQLPSRFGIELFAGTARICEALGNLGHQCFPVDICLFPSHNILDINIEHRLVHWLQSNRITFLWMGMPCTSFSRARKWDGVGPGPLRDYDNLYGFSWLSFSDKRKVEQGNQLLRVTLRLAQLCEHLHIPYAIENPYSSYVWYMPPMLKFITKHMPYIVSLDYCQFGEDWKKPTAILGNFWNVPAVERRCSGSFQSCSMTHRPHVPLSGVSSCGIFRTLLAQPYPRLLADLVASHVAKVI